MTLLQDIIREATAQSTDVPRLLRLCMLLGSRLDHAALQQWCRHELQGYANDVELPTYRVFPVRNRGEFIGPMRSFQATLDIPISAIPEDRRNAYSHARLTEAIAGFSQALEGGDGSDVLMLPWPQEAAVHYGARGMTQGTQCVRAWMELPRGAISAMMDQVKTRVLAFALEIEREYPEAGEVGSPRGLIEERTLSQIFNTTITGNVQNFAAGNRDVSQSAASNVQRGNWSSLESVLSGAGLAPADIASLREAVETDAPADEGPGSRVKAWLADLTFRAGRGVAGIGADVVAGLVTQAILAFYGMSA